MLSQYLIVVIMSIILVITSYSVSLRFYFLLIFTPSISYILTLNPISLYNINFIFIISFSWVCLILSNSSNINNSSRSSLAASLLLIFVSGLSVINTSDIIILIFSFELIMVSSLFLLRVFAKSDRSIEALFEMYMWSLFGSFFLITSVALNYIFLNKLTLLYVFGFMIKLPLWPFTSWLLKAHVEASTEFSIFLSGFLVKFAVISMFKLVTLIGYGLSITIVYNVINSLALIGVLISSIILFSQVDLKRIVAITTIFETNWLALCLFSNSSTLVNLGYLLVIVHCFTTTVEFYLVEFIYRRYGSRNLLDISFMSNLYPNLSCVYLVSTIIIIGLPGSVVFTLKLIFFTNIFIYNFITIIILYFIFFIALPIFFIRLLLILRGGSAPTKKLKALDLSSIEFNIVILPIVIVFVIGLLLFIF